MAYHGRMRASGIREYRDTLLHTSCLKPYTQSQCRSMVTREVDFARVLVNTPVT